MMVEVNRQKLAVDPACREPAKMLRAEFEGSLGPLLERTLEDGPADRWGAGAVRAD